MIRVVTNINDINNVNRTNTQSIGRDEDHFIRDRDLELP